MDCATSKEHYAMTSSENDVALLRTFYTAQQEEYLRRSKFLDTLAQVAQEYDPGLDTHKITYEVTWGFYYFMQITYGIKLGLSATGTLLGDYTVTDEQRHTLFLLKFAS